MSVVNFDPDLKKILFLVTLFFNIIAIPILISSYDKMYQDLKMYEYFGCTLNTPNEMVDPFFHSLGNITIRTTCYKLRIDPKIIGIGHPAQPILWLYPFIILAGLGSLYLTYDFYFSRR